MMVPATILILIVAAALGVWVWTGWRSVQTRLSALERAVADLRGGEEPRGPYAGG